MRVRKVIDIGGDKGVAMPDALKTAQELLESPLTGSEAKLIVEADVELESVRGPRGPRQKPDKDGGQAS